MANFLQIMIESIPNIAVVVGSGQRRRCEGVVRQVPLTIQGCKLVLNLYVLALHGTNVVLRASWFST